jgi:hypothetical protein
MLPAMIGEIRFHLCLVVDIKQATEGRNRAGSPYFSDSAVSLILKNDFPASSETSICQSWIDCSWLEMSRAISANIPAASFLAASLSRQSEAVFVWHWSPRLILNE